MAARELGVPAESVAKLVHAHGWRWNGDGVWSRLAVGDRDPETGSTYAGPPAWARLSHGERIVVDEAGDARPGQRDRAPHRGGRGRGHSGAGRGQGATARRGTRRGARHGRSAGRRQWPTRLRSGLGPPVHRPGLRRPHPPSSEQLHNPAHLFDRLYALGHVRVHSRTEDAHEAIAAATTEAIECHKDGRGNGRDQRRGPLPQRPHPRPTCRPRRGRRHHDRHRERRAANRRGRCDHHAQERQQPGSRQPTDLDSPEDRRRRHRVGARRRRHGQAPTVGRPAQLVRHRPRPPRLRRDRVRRPGRHHHQRRTPCSPRRWTHPACTSG